MSVSVSALGKTDIHFVEPAVKVNGQYYRDVLLKQDLLPDIRQLSEYYIFQHDNAPVHWAHDTVHLLETETPDFNLPTLWPPNSPDLHVNPVDYKIWSVMQEKFINIQLGALINFASTSSQLGKIWIGL